ncbi:hypothetical protein Hanom_Chr06g00539741 [Helianthus anomalus]
MDAKKDMGLSYSRLTQEEVETFCEEKGIDLSFNPVASGLDKSIDHVHLLLSLLIVVTLSFLTFVIRLLSLFLMEYYRTSFKQIHSHGLSRVLHFEVLCRALGYDPPLLMHPDAILNELEPSKSELDGRLLKALRECPSQLCPFPEQLLVLIGVSVLWDKPGRDPMLLRDDQLMSALDFIKYDDASDVVFGDAEAIPGEDAFARRVECRLDGGKYVNVPSVMCSTKAGFSKPSTRRSSRRLLKGPN